MNRKILFTILALGLIGFIALSSETYSSKESPLRQHVLAQPTLSQDAFSLNPQDEGVQGPQPPSPLHVDCPIETDDCGSVTPSLGSAWIADGAWNYQDETLFFVDVPSYSQGVFQVDPVTCDIISGTYYSVGTGVSDRGIAYNEATHEIWVGGWNTLSIDRRDATPPYALISNHPLAVAVAGMAIDQANQRLWVIENADPDMFHVYEISTGTPIFLQSFEVPWQDTHDGWSAAGLAYDDGADTGQLIAVNQDANSKEFFTDDWPNPPIPAGTCVLSNTGFGWGIGIKEDMDPDQGTSKSWVPDLEDFTPPHPIDMYGKFHCEPMLDFECVQVDGTTDVQLSWTLPDEGCLSIEVYRDEVLIVTLASDVTDYLDEGVDPGPHLYEIQCVCTPGSPHMFCEIWVFPAEGPCYDFEADEGGFISEGPTPHWEWGVPSVTPPDGGNAWEVDLGADYHDDDCALLRTPMFAIGPGGAVLEFETYYEIEWGYDGLNVDVSTDLGASWMQIFPVGGYDEFDFGTTTCAETSGDSVFTGTTPGWVVKRFELPWLANEPEVMFRFNFGSDFSIIYPGPIIDEVCVLGGTELPPMLELSCMVLNPDENGDGEPDVYIGDQLRYGLWITNNTSQWMQFSIRHEPYYWANCLDLGIQWPPAIGPDCTLPLWIAPGSTVYRAYGVNIPDWWWLSLGNPWAMVFETWTCSGGLPDMLIDQCCIEFDLTILFSPPLAKDNPVDFSGMTKEHDWNLKESLIDITDTVEMK